MKIELQDELESCVFELKDKDAVSFIKSRLDKGNNFNIFFPEYEV